MSRVKLVEEEARKRKIIKKNYEDFLRKDFPRKNFQVCKQTISGSVEKEFSGM